MNDYAATILIIDDEPQIRRFLKIGLGGQGYAVLEAGSGKEGLALCAAKTPDLVILDLGLPDMDGQQVLEELRVWSQVPVIVLSVRSSEAEKIASLDRGADDYVTKPFGAGELNARIRAALRHRPQGEPPLQQFEMRGLSIDLPKRRVVLDGEAIKLSKKEFDLLVLLARYAGRVLTHRQILREIWGAHHEEDTQYLRVYIGQLRQKLGDDPTVPRFILNEPGVGYRFLDEDEDA
ncbi:DNA-binding response regulator [Alkalilimnicola ehrlichii]|uniref:DNA-binding response regulator n=1 Tax=Alkalilimnicola ehrlichii TaxID=351052 RepID=A0A3E0WWY3_9GAMM|nr:response regulator [Alkalilimnicola ehrlichii]RFA30165.1 DNA-binding response regulator [Alkalilimnicola ehrlichii]RFA37514.1 DNA-binding response regulator [Alkalilimnicola ehrlichii]